MRPSFTCCSRAHDRWAAVLDPSTKYEAERASPPQTAAQAVPPPKPCDAVWSKSLAAAVISAAAGLALCSGLR